MFKSKKEGRLSRRAARFTLLLCKPASWCMWFSVFALLLCPFFPRLEDIVRFALPFAMFGTILSFIPLLGILRCPHCGMPQLMLRGQRLERFGFWGDPSHKFVAQWKAPDGGYCIWCDCLMQYDDIEQDGDA